MPDRGEREAKRIGHAILDLSARLPEGRIDMGGGQAAEGELYVSFNAGAQEWEIEYCALDPERNFCNTGSDLDELLADAIDRDRKVAPDV